MKRPILIFSTIFIYCKVALQFLATILLFSFDTWWPLSTISSAKIILQSMALIFGSKNSFNGSLFLVLGRSNGNPMFRLSGYSRFLMPQYADASLQVPSISCSTWSSSYFETITNSWQSKPPSDASRPLGTSMWCGQPQPQKLKAYSSGVPKLGRCLSKLRNVCSYGIVTVDSVDFRRIMFSPRFTGKTKINYNWVLFRMVRA